MKTVGEELFDGIAAEPVCLGGFLAVKMHCRHLKTKHGDMYSGVEEARVFIMKFSILVVASCCIGLLTSFRKAIW